MRMDRIDFGASPARPALRPSQIRVANLGRKELQNGKRSPKKRIQQVFTSASAEVSDQGWKEEIARLAYEFWLERGSPIGTPEDDWFRAEAEVRSRQ